jgi:replicative superfamily II helicase
MSMPDAAAGSQTALLTQDVANFLGVDVGLFYFDASYRPVPLEMQFVGVSERNILQAKNIMDEICYEKVRWLPVCSVSIMHVHHVPVSAWYEFAGDTAAHTAPDGAMSLCTSQALACN